MTPKYPNYLRLAHISDVHVKKNDILSDKLHIDIIEELKDLAPDIHVCTGDLIDGKDYEEDLSGKEIVQYLQELKLAAHCPGNHDKDHTDPHLISFEERNSICSNGFESICVKNHKILASRFELFKSKFPSDKEFHVTNDGLTNFYHYTFTLINDKKEDVHLRVGIFSINNSWLCIKGKDDTGRLTVGHKEMLRLIERHNDLVKSDGQFDLVLMIMHHPWHYHHYMHELALPSNNALKEIWNLSKLVLIGHTHKQGTSTTNNMFSEKVLECGALHFNLKKGYFQTFSHFLQLKHDGSVKVKKMLQRNVTEYLETCTEEELEILRNDFFNEKVKEKENAARFFVAKSELFGKEIGASTTLRNFFRIPLDEKIDFSNLIDMILLKRVLGELNVDENIEQVDTYFVIKYSFEDLMPKNKCIITSYFSEMYKQTTTDIRGNKDLLDKVDVLNKMKNISYTTLFRKMLWCRYQYSKTLTTNLPLTCELVLEDTEANMGDLDKILLQEKFKNLFPDHTTVAALNIKIEYSNGE